MFHLVPASFNDWGNQVDGPNWGNQVDGPSEGYLSKTALRSSNYAYLT